MATDPSKRGHAQRGEPKGRAIAKSSISDIVGGRASSEAARPKHEVI